MRRAGVVLAVLLALGAAGCGKDEPSNVPMPFASYVPTVAPAAPAAPAGPVYCTRLNGSPPGCIPVPAAPAAPAPVAPAVPAAPIGSSSDDELADEIFASAEVVAAQVCESNGGTWMVGSTAYHVHGYCMEPLG